MSDSPPTLGNVNWGSNVVNGQLVPQAPSSAYFPLFMGAQYTNPKWPSAQPFGVPPVIPSTTIGGMTVGGASTPNAGTPTNPGGSSSLWHPTRGTIVFGLGALILGLFMLHYIHYDGGKK